MLETPQFPVPQSLRRSMSPNVDDPFDPIRSRQRGYSEADIGIRVTNQGYLAKKLTKKVGARAKPKYVVERDSGDESHEMINRSQSNSFEGK